MTDTRSAAAFAYLHRRSPGFVMPNAWDVGSALVLEQAGFQAIATTSAGVAFSMGRQDYGVTDSRLAVSRDAMLGRLAEIVAAASVPVNGDLEAGYGDSPEAVAETVRAAIDAGLAGGNIEDKVPLEPRLYDESLAVERIVAARETIDASGRPFVLTARSDAIMWCSNSLEAAIERSNRYRQAGADCLFTPGASDSASIALLVREIDGPLNLVMGLGTTEGNAYEWLEAGVQRISLGGTFARATLDLLRRAAHELANAGTISFAATQMSMGEANSLFGRQRDDVVPR